MALITCPNCGKQVSDTNGKCFHCGYDFTTQKEKPPKLQEYFKMSAKQQTELRENFYKEKPNYKNYMQKYNKFLKSINISFGVHLLSSLLFITLLIGGQIYHRVTKKDAANWAIILVVIFFVVTLISLIVNVLQRKILFKKYRRNELIIEKKFQKWLKEEKQLIYTVSFSAKQKKDKAFFDSVDANKDDIEV